MVIIMNIKKHLFIFCILFIVSFIALNGYVFGVVTYRNHKLSKYDLNHNWFYEANEQMDDFGYWENKSNNSSIHMLFLSKELVYSSLVISFSIIAIYDLIVIICKYFKKRL